MDKYVCGISLEIKYRLYSAVSEKKVYMPSNTIAKL